MRTSRRAGVVSRSISLFQSDGLGSNPGPRSVSRGDYVLIEASAGECADIIVPNHYSRKVTKNAELCFLVYYKGNVEGALSLGYGIRPKMKHTWGIDDSGTVREFDRMWLSDVCPKNSETVVISLLVKWLRRYRPDIRYLLSYADGTAGKRGIIYKAFGFTELEPIRADFYLLPNGERVHPVTMWHRHKTRAWEFLQSVYPGIKHLRGLQYRFIFDLHKRRVRSRVSRRSS
jgi:hypothetical protein